MSNGKTIVVLESTSAHPIPEHEIIERAKTACMVASPQVAVYIRSKGKIFDAVVLSNGAINKSRVYTYIEVNTFLGKG
jgi:hypothetical protein